MGVNTSSITNGISLAGLRKTTIPRHNSQFST
jgi:hypothetical protein